MYYDINNAASDLVSEWMVLQRAICDGKIAYYADIDENRNCTINLYDINTKLTQTFELYKTTRDFPEADSCRLEWLYEVVPDGNGYAFIFKVGYYDNLKSTGIDRYLVYSTETDKAVVLFENDSNKFKEVTISPSGNYILIAPYNQYGYPHGYPLEVVKTSEYIHPNVNVSE